MMQAKQPLSEIMEMPYWKFEAFIERLNKRNDEQAAQEKKQREQSEAASSSGSNMSKFNPSNIMNGFKIPKFK